ncbi:MAG: type II toxin-antitoxin system HicA family toxin [Marinomonas colpomeniae]
MKQSEFRRQLEKLGVEVKQGKNHLKLYYEDKQSVMPRHPGKEIPEGTRKAILKQLGMNV